MRCRDWCGSCYEGLKGRATRRGHTSACGHMNKRRSVNVASFKGPVPSAAGAVGVVRPWMDAQLDAVAPALRGWLGDADDDDGHPRDGGTMLLFVEDARLKCCLHDRQTGYKAFCSAYSWEELLGVVEELLATGKGDWRAPKEQPQRKGHRGA